VWRTVPLKLTWSLEMLWPMVTGLRQLRPRTFHQ
jgi:hypothetical protein